MKRVALYAHYSSNDVVAKHVFYHLLKLREFGFQVCFISNSPISFSSEELLKGICERIIQRENVGYDFSMWQQGLSHYERSQMDELLLTNSSIIGPFAPLACLWQRTELGECDLWGLTDNCDYARHIQSFFIVFRRNLIQSEAFARFWASVLPFFKASLLRPGNPYLPTREAHAILSATSLPKDVLDDLRPDELEELNSFR
jgi:rhamnosyltransferase